MVMLAELDSSGGFESFVNDVAAKLNAAGEKGDLAGIGKELAIAAGKFALEQALKKLKSSLKDDVFPPVLETVEIDTEDFRFPKGELTSPLKTVIYKAHNGKYAVTHAWRLAA
jgi:hypothetical protein